MAIRFGTGSTKIGRLISVMIDFAVVAAVVYYIFKGLRLDRLDEKASASRC